MVGMVSFGLAVLFAFSYRVVELLLVLVVGANRARSMDTLGVYLWGLSAIAAALIMKDHYVFRFPVVDTTVCALAAVVLLANTVISHYSGYQPTGRISIIQYIVLYPIAEEMIFRGLMLPILHVSFDYTVFELFDLPVSLSVVITALLFAAAHLQYNKLNRTRLIYMMSFAFIGGVLFGVIAEATQSILIPVLLHVEFNWLSYYYSSRVKTE